MIQRVILHLDTSNEPAKNQCSASPHSSIANRGSEQELRDLNLNLERQVKDLQERINRLEEVNRELEDGRDEAQQALALKSQFVANISHEIRTPMSGVLGMAELLMMSDMDDESHILSEHIYHSAKSLLSIVNDILDFSKLEAGKVQLERRSFDVTTIVYQVVQSIKAAAGKKNIQLSYDIDAAIPSQLQGDDGRIRQTLLNLAHNAIKFTEQGSIKIAAQLEEQSADTAIVRFEIQDTGIGIAPDARHRLFLPFMQADNSTTRRFGGTGLGLSICKSLVTLMSGDLGVESKEGEGATFWFVVPLQKVASRTDSAAR